MSRDRLRRTHLGVLAGAGGLALAVSVSVAAAGAVQPVGSPSVPAAPAAASPGRSPGPGLGLGSGAASGATPSPTPSASIGKGEGTLQVLTFQGHVEYGGTSSRANWVSSFEEETGCRVAKLDRVKTEEEMAAKLVGNSYDVISPPPELAGRLVAEGRVAPVDTALLDFYKDIPKRLRELPAVRRAGKVYGVPYLWGVNQVIYEMGRPQGPEALYATTPVAIRDSPLSIADAALALGRTDPGLGVEDPFQLTPAQLDAAVKLLAERDGPDRVYWKDSIDVIRAFASGSVRLAQALPYHRDLFQRAGRPVKALDSAPMTGWVDSWMLAAKAASPNCAYRWLNWMGSAKVQRSAAAWTGLAPANPDACGGRADRMCEIYHVRDDDWIRRIFFAARPTRDCGGRGGECTDYTDWTQRWKNLVR
ncbi:MULTISPECIES: extracellular solute-binding protein [Streptosporangium]|uniref:Spermidine/putrescine transport system substrate-binding protein n=1 Tax=Streptosporangium brasiliense TaxID=47480 RepID=A0ABT9QVM7_9ACTN|nr:extracellular solute-binding protein [Streptosporangium brasiliense]MDP9861033.1 putative spermidine/putrescine transport system substrate-binding protein [Streptosporangium brasiliense]